ncbi:MAG: DUF309 domain-containing protein [Chloroflexi bacterium]|nr:DUF309 domain-containing protein [Chloroflexota bacterium]
MHAAIVCLSHSDAFATLLDIQVDSSIIALDDAAAFVPALIENRAALALIDAEHSAAHSLILTAKTSAATRRIPIVLVSADAAARAHAIAAGAELALDWAELAKQLSVIIRELARMPGPEALAQLDCACAQSLPPLAAAGVEAFNRGEYYQQHDLFEELWVATEGPVRDLYRAILQVGVAYFQLERGNFRGALKMLQRSVQWLYLLPDTCQGLDVAALRRDSYAVRAELQRLGADRLGEFDLSLLKPLRWQPPQT